MKLVYKTSGPACDLKGFKTDEQPLDSSHTVKYRTEERLNIKLAKMTT